MLFSLRDFTKCCMSAYTQMLVRRPWLRNTHNLLCMSSYYLEEALVFLDVIIHVPPVTH